MRPIALIRLICGAALTAMLALSASSCGGSAPATLDPVAQAAGVTSHLGGAHLSISGQIGGAGLASPAPPICPLMLTCAPPRCDVTAAAWATGSSVAGAEPPQLEADTASIAVRAAPQMRRISAVGRMLPSRIGTAPPPL